MEFLTGFLLAFIIGLFCGGIIGFIFVYFVLKAKIVNTAKKMASSQFVNLVDLVK